MRTTFKIALASVLVFTLAAAAPELNAQARRSTTTTSSTSSSSDNKSAATATRSAASNASTATRSTSTATRSAGTTTNRQSTNTSTATRSTSTATRSTAAPSGSTSTQVRRGSNTGSNTGSTGAQVNRNTGGTTTNNGSQVNRNTGNGTATNGNTGTAVRRSTGTSNTEATTARRQTPTGTTATQTPSRRATTTGTAAAEAPAAQSSAPVRTVRSNANTTSSRGLTSAPEATAAAKANVSRGGVNANRGAVANVNYSGGREERADIRMDKDRNLNRIPPRERDFMTYDRPGVFYGHDPHFFGYRVHTLPPRYRRVTYWGRDYYYYNNVYYLRYGNIYVISRPPFGIALDIAIRDAVFASVRFSYYHNVYRTFDIVDRNYRTILEQNREIARNNALIAQQNSALALNSSRALSAYEIASALGLVQSFANINTEYFYQDGVFYVVNRKNRYEVIVPPAGALVNELPEDYDTIVLNGVEYYKVDDTVYRLVLVDGIPALEVLGQMYGTMAQKYNYYY